MTVYVLQWEEYLRGFTVNDFQTEEEAIELMDKLEEKDNPALTVFYVEDDSSFKNPDMSSSMRRDVYNIMSDEGYEAGAEESISSERLFSRLEIWVKE